MPSCEAAKAFLGRYRIDLSEEAKIFFGETSLTLPDEELAYEDVFYRHSDAIVFEARRLELVDRCYSNVWRKIEQHRLRIGSDTYKPDDVPVMEAVTRQLVMPREAMGPGDIKFMGAIGAFLGWPAVIFSLAVSSFIGTGVGVISIVAGKREWSSRIPYGPYIAMGAAIWLFGGYQWVWRLFGL